MGHLNKRVRGPIIDLGFSWVICRKALGKQEFILDGVLSESRDNSMIRYPSKSYL